MKGLFFSDEAYSTTFLMFYPDGSVILYGKSMGFDQILPSFPWLRVDSDKVNFGRGKYFVDTEGRIRIIVESNLGKIDYRGTIQNKDRIEFRRRCPITNHRRTEHYLRFSEKENTIQFEMLGNKRSHYLK